MNNDHRAAHAHACQVATQSPKIHKSTGNHPMFNRPAIAQQYIAGKACTPTVPETIAFEGWLTGQWAPIASLVDCTDQPVDPVVFVAYWQAKGRLLITTANSEHPFWDLRLNTMFRAVHDWHHLAVDQGFGWEGEVAAYRFAIKHAPERIHWILRSEILGQAAVALEFGSFPSQKLVYRIAV